MAEITRSEAPYLKNTGASRDVNGRTLAPPAPTPPPVNPAPSNRQVSNRDPIAARQNEDVPRTLYNPNTIPTSGTTNGTNNNLPPTGSQDPFGTLSDIFRTFYGSNPVDDPRDSGPVVVGDAGLSQGSSSGSGALIFVILLAVGGIGYYIYKKYKGGQATQ